MPSAPAPSAQPWPRLMRAEQAAAYVGERNPSTFRRAIGSLYPRPHRVKGKGERWLKEDLDKAIDQLTGHVQAQFGDAAWLL